MPVLKGSKNFYEYDLNDTLNYNIKSWLEYGLLEMGAYTTVGFSTPASGFTTLKGVHDDRYGDHRVYEGLGPSWAWETGVVAPSGYSSVFQVSGVFVNNVYRSISTTGASGYFVDYRNGRIIFNSTTTGTVRCEYTARDVDVFLSDANKWKVITDEFEKRYDSLDTLSPSGMASILKENRVWLPSIVVDSNRNFTRGIQLGGGELVDSEINFYVFADSPFANNKICDLLLNQFQANINLFDVNAAPKTYNFNGSIFSGAVPYNSLVNRSSPYFWTYATITNVNGGPKGGFSDLFTGQVVFRCETERYLSTY